METHAHSNIQSRLTGQCTRSQDGQFKEETPAVGMPRRLRKVLSMQFLRSPKEEGPGCVRHAVSPMLAVDAADNSGWCHGVGH
eukprot:2901767-Rhodomonas_salina.2